MNYNLFLDDVRMPRDVKWIELPLVNWTIVRSYPEFVAMIEFMGELPSIISFDHDLGAEHYPTGEQTGNEKLPYESYKEKTGYHCALWLCEYCLKKNLPLPDYLVHSLNIAGRANIESLLQSFKNR